MLVYFHLELFPDMSLLTLSKSHWTITYYFQSEIHSKNPSITMTKMLQLYFNFINSLGLYNVLYFYLVKYINHFLYFLPLMSCFCHPTPRQ